MSLSFFLPSTAQILYFSPSVFYKDKHKERKRERERERERSEFRAVENTLQVHFERALSKSGTKRQLHLHGGVILAKQRQSMYKDPLMSAMIHSDCTNTESMQGHYTLISYEIDAGIFFTLQFQVKLYPSEPHHKAFSSLLLLPFHR